MLYRSALTLRPQRVPRTGDTFTTVTYTQSATDIVLLPLDTRKLYLFIHVKSKHFEVLIFTLYLNANRPCSPKGQYAWLYQGAN